MSYIKFLTLFALFVVLGIILFSGSVAAECGNGVIDVYEQCDDGNLDETDSCKNNCQYNLDCEIPVDPSFPPGGVSYINWDFADDFERLNIKVNILELDTSKYFYLQFYQSMIGDDGFYFGVQNRVDENDQMLIFSRWGATDLANVEVNPDGGFSQSAGYEGDFVGVRLPNFELKNGEYIFSIAKDREDGTGTWYRYAVVEKLTGIETWGGSIRFDKGAKISKHGSTWTKLYGTPWPIQTYTYLPSWDVEIKSIKGDNKLPTSATSSYSDPTWGDHIPMENIYYDSSKNSIRMQLGPIVVRENDAGTLTVFQETSLDSLTRRLANCEEERLSNCENVKMLYDYSFHGELSSEQRIGIEFDGFITGCYDKTDVAIAYYDEEKNTWVEKDTTVEKTRGNVYKATALIGYLGYIALIRSDECIPTLCAYAGYRTDPINGYVDSREKITFELCGIISGCDVSRNGICDMNCPYGMDSDCVDDEGNFLECTSAGGDCCLISKEGVCDLDCAGGVDPDCGSACLSIVAFHRLAKVGDEDHFYTTDEGVVGNPPSGYNYEGVAGYIYPSGIDPVPAGAVKFYRFAKPGGDEDHYYSIEETTPTGYTSEGVAGYIYPLGIDPVPAGAVKFHRLAKVGDADHFYTTDEGVVGNPPSGYNYEGVAGYVYPSGPVSAQEVCDGVDNDCDGLIDEKAGQTITKDYSGRGCEECPVGSKYNCGVYQGWLDGTSSECEIPERETFLSGETWCYCHGSTPSCGTCTLGSVEEAKRDWEFQAEYTPQEEEGLCRKNFYLCRSDSLVEETDEGEIYGRCVDGEWCNGKTGRGDYVYSLEQIEDFGSCEYETEDWDVGSNEFFAYVCDANGCYKFEEGGFLVCDPDKGCDPCISGDCSYWTKEWCKNGIWRTEGYCQSLCGFYDSTCDYCEHGNCDAYAGKWCNQGYWTDVSYCECDLCGGKDSTCGCPCEDGTCDMAHESYCERGDWPSLSDCASQCHIGCGIQLDCIEQCLVQCEEAFFTKCCEKVYTYYKDSDGDGYGRSDITKQGCTTPQGYSQRDWDFDDGDASIHPGLYFENEDCSNNKDNDLDGKIPLEDDECVLSTSTKPSCSSSQRVDSIDISKSTCLVSAPWPLSGCWVSYDWVDTEYKCFAEAWYEPDEYYNPAEHSLEGMDPDDWSCIIKKVDFKDVWHDLLRNSDIMGATVPVIADSFFDTGSIPFLRDPDCEAWACKRSPLYHCSIYHTYCNFKEFLTEDTYYILYGLLELIGLHRSVAAIIVSLLPYGTCEDSTEWEDRCYSLEQAYTVERDWTCYKKELIDYISYKVNGDPYDRIDIVLLGYDYTIDELREDAEKLFYSEGETVLKTGINLSYGLFPYLQSEDFLDNLEAKCLEDIEESCIKDPGCLKVEEVRCHEEREDTKAIIDLAFNPLTKEIPLYRLYSGTAFDHFYTIINSEKNEAMLTQGYTYEGVAGYVLKTQQPGTIPLYRLYSDEFKTHFYVTSESKKDIAVSIGYTYGGIDGYIYETQQPDTVPLYNLYKAWCSYEDPDYGEYCDIDLYDYIYTTSESEKDNAVLNGYAYERIIGYVYTTEHFESKYEGWLSLLQDIGSLLNVESIFELLPFDKYFNIWVVPRNLQEDELCEFLGLLLDEEVAEILDKGEFSWEDYKLISSKFEDLEGINFADLKIPLIDQNASESKLVGINPQTLIDTCGPLNEFIEDIEECTANCVHSCPPTPGADTYSCNDCINSECGIDIGLPDIPILQECTTNCQDSCPPALGADESTCNDCVINECVIGNIAGLGVPENVVELLGEEYSSSVVDVYEGGFDYDDYQEGFVSDYDDDQEDFMSGDEW